MSSKWIGSMGSELLEVERRRIDLYRWRRPAAILLALVALAG